jgi:chemotaxis protein MotB
VRGYADQKLRVPGNPLEPSNRRISLIVQYIVKDDDETPVPAPDAKSEAKPVGTPEAKPEAKAEANQESQH